MTLPSMLLMLLGRLGLRDRDGVTVDRRVVRWGSVAAFAGVGSMLIHPEKVMNHEAGVGISALELAGTREKIDDLFELWGPNGLRAARRSLIVDQAWLVTYTVMLSVLAQEAADRYHRRGWHRMAELATPMGVTAAGAAACDVVENTTLLALVNGSPSRTLPRVARQAALTKFGLLGAVVTYLLGGVLFGKPAHH